MGSGQSRAAVSVERFFQLSLLGLVASGYLAVAGSGYLDLPTIVLVAAGLLLRGLLVTGVVLLRIPERMVTVVTLAYIGFYPLDYQFLSRDFLQATVHLVFFLAVVKILTAKAGRDYIYVGTIAFLEILAAAMLSTNLNFFLFLGLYLLFAIAAFTSAEIRRATEKPWSVARSGLKRFHWRLAALSVFVGLAILSLTGGLFFLLPRTANAALQRWMRNRDSVPGFANQVDLGDIGQIKLSSRTIMHVRIYNETGPLHLKWRGNTLTLFDGHKWFNPDEASEVLRTDQGRLVLATDDQRRRRGKRLLYMVSLKALDSDALFFAGLPEALNLNAPSIIRTRGDSYRLGTGFSDGVKYEAFSLLSEAAGTGETVAGIAPFARRRYLQLPPVDGRIPVLARRVVAGQLSDLGRARAVEEYLRTRYGYTLDLPREESRDPLARFLFERKKGHCEYFASAMAVMLRAVGIPARLATGFESGSFNPISGQYVVRASDAHSWVEAYIPEQGWLTFDPTPPDLGGASASVWARLMMYADAADTFWQDWVVGYDLGQQLSLAARMERSSRRVSVEWAALVRNAAAGALDSTEAALTQYGLLFLAAAGSIALVWLVGPRLYQAGREQTRLKLLRRGQARASDATLLYARMLALLRRRGYEKPAWFTATEFAGSIPASELGNLVQRFTAAYHDVRFGGRLASAAHLPPLLDEMEQLKR